VIDEYLKHPQAREDFPHTSQVKAGPAGGKIRGRWAIERRLLSTARLRRSGALLSSDDSGLEPALKLLGRRSGAIGQLLSGQLLHDPHPMAGRADHRLA
jgi:hypothetical protein